MRRCLGTTNRIRDAVHRISRDHECALRLQSIGPDMDRLAEIFLIQNAGLAELHRQDSQGPRNPLDPAFQHCIRHSFHVRPVHSPLTEFYVAKPSFTISERIFVRIGEKTGLPR